MKISTSKNIAAMLLLVAGGLFVAQDTFAGARAWTRQKSAGTKYYARTNGSHFRVLLCYRISSSFGNTANLNCQKAGLYSQAFNGISSGAYTYTNTWRWYARAGSPNLGNELPNEKPYDGHGLGLAAATYTEVKTDRENRQMTVKDLEAFLSVGMGSNFISNFKITVWRPEDQNTDEELEIDSKQIAYQAFAFLKNGKLELSNNLDRRDFDNSVGMTVELPQRLKSEREVVIGEDVNQISQAHFLMEELVIDIPPGFEMDELEFTIECDSYYETPIPSHGDEFCEEIRLEVLPNPVIDHGKVELQLPIEKDVQLHLIDAQGSIRQVLFSGLVAEETLLTREIDVAAIEPGFYDIRLITDDAVCHKKLIRSLP